MTVEETLQAQHDARLALIHCAWYLRERDNMIRNAAMLGITKTEIARILGMNRGHISDIANAKPSGPPNASQPERPAQHPKDDTDGIG